METLERIKVMVKAVDDLEYIVDQFGHDHVYVKEPKPGQPAYGNGGCWYVKDGEPDCLIAKFLFNRGWTIEELSSCESRSVFSASGDYPDRLTNDEVSILSTAQQVQDNGKTWGEALRAAKLEAFYLTRQLVR